MKMEEDVAKELSEEQEEEQGVQFSVGRFYQHTSGGKLGILGVLPDLEGGEVMVARTQVGELVRISGFHTREKNYSEITPQEFYSGMDEGDVPEPDVPDVDE